MLTVSAMLPPSLRHLPPPLMQPYKPGMPDIALTKKQLTDLDGGDLVKHEFAPIHYLRVCLFVFGFAGSISFKLLCLLAPDARTFPLLQPPWLPVVSWHSPSDRPSVSL